MGNIGILLIATAIVAILWIISKKIHKNDLQREQDLQRDSQNKIEQTEQINDSKICDQKWI